MITVKEQLERWERRLSEAGIDCAFAESEWIYCHAANKTRGEIFFEQTRSCPEKVSAIGDAVVARRVTREPLQYILGVAPFMEFELIVTPAVLIPRPETEILVEFLLQNMPRGGRLLDVGTGSGAIALASAYGRSDIDVLALDISDDALEVAARNRAMHQLNHRVEFRRSDLLSAVDSGERFDMIAANLPYVTEQEYLELEPEVKMHEPKLALTAPDEGLALIVRLAQEAVRALKPGGVVIFELGHQQAGRLCEYLERCGCWGNIRVVPDYNRIERFVTACLKGA